MTAYAKELGALTRILSLFMEQERRVAERATYDISAARCLVFTAIASSDGRLSQIELAGKDRLNLKPNVLGRHVQALSEWERPGRPGLGLIEQRVDPMDSRRKLLFLTPAGRDFAEKLIGTVNGERTVRLDAAGPDEVMRQRWAEAAASPTRKPRT